MSPPSAPRPPAVELMTGLGWDPDPWQLEVLEGGHSRLLLNCCRQAGKSTVVAMLALAETVWTAGTRVLLVSRSQRQAEELFRIMTDAYRRLGHPMEMRLTAHEMELENQSRVVCLPCREDTIRGYANVGLLVIDEAARVPDPIYRALRPMLAVSGGRLICLSTPFGKRGFFYDAWARGGADWKRIEVPASKVSRIMPAFLEEERRAHGDSYCRQEYECSFESLEGLVYPDFGRCVVEDLSENLRQLQIDNCKLQNANLDADRPSPPTPLPIRGRGENSDPSPLAPLPQGARGEMRGADSLTPRPSPLARLPQGESGGYFQWVGGMDFGFRNPFAAVWGVLDNDDVLWLVGEHYARGKPLSYHAERLPREVTWYADPAGAMERCELRRADFVVRQGKNALRLGIAAVSARLNNGTLKVLKGCCPNLVAEAGLYCWGESSTDRSAEEPVDDHNHALAALRYLIASIDEGRMIRPRKQEAGAGGQEAGRRQEAKVRNFEQEDIEDDEAFLGRGVRYFRVA